MKKQISLILILGSCFLINASCSSAGDIDKIGDAQECLDKYTREGVGTLEACEAKIEGVETPAAYSIRCASGYIREGFTAQGFIDAFSEIETVSGSNVANFLNRMTFNGAGNTGAAAVEANYEKAQEVYGYCAESLAKGATILATFSYLVNAIYNYECNGGVGSCDVTDSTAFGLALAAAIVDGTARGDTLNTDLGTIVVNTQTVSCTAGAANETLCGFLDRAVDDAGGTADKEAVGRAFLNVLANP